MDTVLLLEGEIGRNRLSTQAKKRISTYNTLKAEIANLKKAVDNAEDDDKATYKSEFEDAYAYLEEIAEETIDFLADELADLKAKDKVKDEIKAKADGIAKDKADAKAKEIEDAKAKEIEDAKTPEEEKKSSGVSGWLVGAIVLVASAGLVNHFRK
jgi:hypothetical protein